MTTLRLPLTFQLGLPEIEVRIGEHARRLLVDTGAGAAVSLHGDLLGLPGVAVVDSTASFGDAVGRRFEARRFTVERLTLDEETFPSVAGIENVFSPDFAPPNEHGYVGRALFAGRRLLFDYAQARLMVSTGELSAEESSLQDASESAELEVDRDGWSLRGTLDGAPVRMLLDTCSTHSLLAKPADGAFVRDFVAGGIRHERLELVGAPLQGPAVDGILGANFFAARRILLDPERGRVWAAPALVAPSPAE